MEKRIAFLYGITSILFFSVMIVLAVFRIAGVRENSFEKLSEEFIRLERSLASAYTEGNGINSETFRGAARNYMLNSNALQMLLVYSYDEGLLYFLPRNAETYDAAILDFQGRTIPRVRYNFISENKIAEPLSVPDKKGLVLEGVYTVLPVSDQFIILRDSLIAFCIFFLVTCIVIAVISVINIRKKDTALNDSHEDYGTNGYMTHESPVRNPSGAGFTTEKDILFKEDIPDYRPDDTAENFTIDVEDLEDTRVEDLSGFIDPPEPKEGTAVSREVMAPILKKVEQFLDDAEKEKSEVILSLVKISDMRNRNHFTLLKEHVNSTFHDLASVQDFSDDTLLLLLYHTDLDEAIHELEKLYGLMQYDADSSILAGLTVKSGRSITAHLFLKEAEQALARTRNEQGERIIGFKPDPKKYRSVLSRM